MGVTNGTEATVTVNAGQTATATLSFLGDPHFCHISELFLFETASSFIDSSIPGHKLAFREVLDRLNQVPPGESLLVVGHTDEAGPEPDNDQLSQRRADSVLAVLRGDVSVWETIYRTEQGSAWEDNDFRTMLQEVTGSPPSQTEINQHKVISAAGEQRRVTLFTQYFDALLGNPGSSVLVDTLMPPTLACGERHILGSGNHAPSRRAEIFLFRGNVSPQVICDEYPNWLTPCQILPPATVTVTIAPVDSIVAGQIERVQVTVNPSPLPLGMTITLELNTTVGTGEAQFVSTNLTTMELSQSEAVRIRAITQSSTNDNIRLSARISGEANVLAHEDFTIAVREADTFELEVQGATQIGGATGSDFLEIRNSTGEVLVTAVFPAGTAAPATGVIWAPGSGAEVPGNPLQRQISRASIGQTTVTATMPSSGVTKSVDIFIVRLTLDVDANRDGVVGQDEEGRDVWDFGASQKGAVILVNNDDDDLTSDLDLEDTAVDGASDVTDLAPITIRQTGPLPPGVTIVLSLADKSKARVFNQRSAAGKSIIGPSSLSNESVITGVTGGDVELGIEGTSYPDSGFDGVIDLKLSLKEGATELASDNVKVRAAPWILPSHLNVTKELYIVDISGFNDKFVSEIEAIASGVGVPLVKASVNDQWMQDCMEIGYSHTPTKQFSVALNAVNPRDLDSFARDKLLGPDYGFHQPPLTSSSTFDSHGNIEVSPPVKVGGKEFKFGRIYFGGVPRSPTTFFNVDVENFLKAQAVQKPFSIDTTWLGVGHVDEIVSFIPSKVGREFRMLFASVDEGLRILGDLQSAGHGSLTLSTGKNSAHLAALAASFGFGPTDLDHFRERTIDAILSDATLMAVNAGVQTRLNSVKTKFETELGKDAAKDIILIPSLFTTETLAPGPVSALIPGMVNLLVITRPSFADNRLVFPKPFGPVLGGVDQLEKDVQDKIIPLGYSSSQLKFADDFDTYHVLLGEVHCGTNSKRQPHGIPWYEQEDF